MDRSFEIAIKRSNNATTANNQLIQKRMQLIQNEINLVLHVFCTNYGTFRNVIIYGYAKCKCAVIFESLVTPQTKTTVLIYFFMIR